MFAVFAILIGAWLVRPMRKRVNDLQVALYVEEHEPKLQAAILAAVDLGSSPDVPAIIVDKLVEQAVEKAKTIDGGKSIGRVSMQRSAVALSLIAGVGALLLVVGPEFLRQGASALLVLSKSAEAASPYAISVQPGDTEVPKGSDQTILARLAGFRSNDVGVWVKAENEQKFSRVPLVVTGETDKFEGMLFDVKASLTYYVEADGVKSPTYKMSVVELPAVTGIEMEYVYPAYTGLAPQKVEVGGDVAAIAGTEVRLKITSSMATPGGRLQLDPAAVAGLTVQADGTLTGSFKVMKDGYYHVELDGPRGEKVTASPKYTIDVIEDRAPTVSFDKPKRDTSANPVEEVFVQARAQDDYGVRQLDLIYSVNGGPEKTVTLFGKGAKALEEVSAGHTIYMEELGVKAGDFVSYYAKAYDTDTVNGPKVTSSDIYFVQIRPFSQNFREAQSQGGGGGGGGGRQGQPGALSAQQRQIISATFNVERDRPKTAVDKFKEDTVFVQLAQSKIREEVQELLQQMKQRIGAEGGENIQHIIEALPKAAQAMAEAEELLKSLKPKEALAPEQRALKHLQDAEQAYELEVRRQQQGGGGGGGGGGQMAEELADLFQLQLDRMANQYETQQRAQQQSGQQQVDEMAERLKELARRQLLQAEQQARGRQQAGSGTGGSQRSLADEMEEAARQLEQLRREAERQGQQRQDLADAARRLQEGANSARQAAANGNNDAGAQAKRALQQIQEAQRLLQNSQGAQTGQNARDLQRQAEELSKQQREVSKQVASLDSAGGERQQRIQQLSQAKDEMRGKVGEIEQQLNKLSQQSLANNQRDAARKLQEAAGAIRDDMLKEKIEYSKQAMAGGSEYSKPIENEIGSNIDTLRQRIADAAAAADRAQQGQGLSKGAQQSADLLRGLQTLGQQINPQGNQQGQGQQGQGQQGQGQQGQGQQGQGQQGQGQQGQGQQGQGQQGQGQQGQGQQGQGQQGQGQQGQGQQGQGSKARAARPGSARSGTGSGTAGTRRSGRPGSGSSGPGPAASRTTWAAEPDRRRRRRRCATGRGTGLAAGLQLGAPACQSGHGSPPATPAVRHRVQGPHAHRRRGEGVTGARQARNRRRDCRTCTRLLWTSSRRSTSRSASASTRRTSSCSCRGRKIFPRVQDADRGVLPATGEEEREVRRVSP